MAATIVVALILLVPQSFAAIVTFQGVDSAAVNKSQLANAFIARTNFAAAVGSGRIVETLEAAIIGGSRANWSVGALTFQRIGGTNSGILEVASAGEFPTSGTNYAFSNGSSSILTFGTNINAFGAFFTDVGDLAGTLTLRFNDGSVQNLAMPTTSASDSGGMFFGFSDLRISEDRLRQ